MPPSERRKTSLLLLGSLLIGLAVVEVGLRALAPPHLGTQAPSRFELDPDLIYRMRPHNVARWTTPEFTELSHTNSLGLRSGEVRPKRAGERRILAIGDSFTYGHGVQDDEAYPAVLEALLRARGHTATVLNAGVPGYSTDQAYRYFVRDGLRLAPDVLLVGIHCSDISDNFESSLYDLADGRLVQRDAQHTWMYRLGSIVRSTPALLQRSRLFDVLVASIDWHDPESRRPAVADRAAWSRQKIQLEVADMRARGASLGIAVGVILMPCKKALTPAAQDPYGPLADELAGAGIPVLDGATEMRHARPDPHALFFRDDPHLNAAGYRVLAAVVAAFLEERELLGRESTSSGTS